MAPLACTHHQMNFAPSHTNHPGPILRFPAPLSTQPLRRTSHTHTIAARPIPQFVPATASRPRSPIFLLAQSQAISSAFYSNLDLRSPHTTTLIAEDKDGCVLPILSIASTSNTKRSSISLPVIISPSQSDSDHLYLGALLVYSLARQDWSFSLSNSINESQC